MKNDTMAKKRLNKSISNGFKSHLPHQSRAVM